MQQTKQDKLNWWKKLSSTARITLINTYLPNTHVADVKDYEVESIYNIEFSDTKKSIESVTKPVELIFGFVSMWASRMGYVVNKKYIVNQEIDDLVAQGHLRPNNDSAKTKKYSSEDLEKFCKEAWIESFFKKRNTDITGFKDWFDKLEK